MEKQKILFAFAPTADTRDRFFNCYPGSILHAVSPLINKIDNGNLDVDYVPLLFHPQNYTDRTLPNLEEIIRREKPTILAVSSTYDSWHTALKIAKHAKLINPELVCIHGGPHLDEVLEAWVLKSMPHLSPFNGKPETSEAIDFAIAGDAEYSFLKLVDSISKYGVEHTKRLVISNGYEDLPGRGTIAFILDDSVEIVRYKNTIDLDLIPPIPRHLLPASSLYDFDCFKDNIGQNIETVTMITHRGCKSRCDFCSEGLPYQQRSIGHILNEAKRLRSMGVKALFLDDSTIQDDDNHMVLFAELSRLGFQIGVLSRFDLLQDEKRVKEMRRNGVTYLYASIEQYDNEALGGMHKRIQTREIDIAIENLRKAGISIGISTLFGLPYETERSVRATIDYVRKRTVEDNCFKYISMSLFSFHPRTPISGKNKDFVGHLDFDNSPPNLRHPFTGFEEGSWYHPAHVTEEYVENILREANMHYGKFLVRNIGIGRGKL